MTSRNARAAVAGNTRMTTRSRSRSRTNDQVSITVPEDVAPASPVATAVVVEQGLVNPSGAAAEPAAIIGGEKMALGAMALHEPSSSGAAGIVAGDEQVGQERNGQLLTAENIALLQQRSVVSTVPVGGGVAQQQQNAVAAAGIVASAGAQLNAAVVTGIVAGGGVQLDAAVVTGIVAGGMVAQSGAAVVAGMLAGDMNVGMVSRNGAQLGAAVAAGSDAGGMNAGMVAGNGEQLPAAAADGGDVDYLLRLPLPRPLAWDELPCGAASAAASLANSLAAGSQDGEESTDNEIPHLLEPEEVERKGIERERLRRLHDARFGVVTSAASAQPEIAQVGSGIGERMSNWLGRSAFRGPSAGSSREPSPVEASAQRTAESVESGMGRSAATLPRPAPAAPARSCRRGTSLTPADRAVIAERAEAQVASATERAHAQAAREVQASIDAATRLAEQRQVRGGSAVSAAGIDIMDDAALGGGGSARGEPAAAAAAASVERGRAPVDLQERHYQELANRLAASHGNGERNHNVLAGEMRAMQEAAAAERLEARNAQAAMQQSMGEMMRSMMAMQARADAAENGRRLADQARLEDARVAEQQRRADALAFENARAAADQQHRVDAAASEAARLAAAAIEAQRVNDMIEARLAEIRSERSHSGSGRSTPRGGIRAATAADVSSVLAGAPLASSSIAVRSFARARGTGGVGGDGGGSSSSEHSRSSSHHGSDGGDNLSAASGEEGDKPFKKTKNQRHAMARGGTKSGYSSSSSTQRRRRNAAAKRRSRSNSGSDGEGVEAAAAAEVRQGGERSSGGAHAAPARVSHVADTSRGDAPGEDFFYSAAGPSFNTVPGPALNGADAPFFDARDFLDFHLSAGETAELMAFQSIVRVDQAPNTSLADRAAADLSNIAQVSESDSLVAHIRWQLEVDGVQVDEAAIDMDAMRDYMYRVQATPGGVVELLWLLGHYRVYVRPTLRQRRGLDRFSEPEVRTRVEQQLRARMQQLYTNVHARSNSGQLVHNYGPGFIRRLQLIAEQRALHDGAPFNGNASLMTRELRRRLANIGPVYLDELHRNHTHNELARREHPHRREEAQLRELQLDGATFTLESRIRRARVDHERSARDHRDALLRLRGAEAKGKVRPHLRRELENLGAELAASLTTLREERQRYREAVARGEATRGPNAPTEQVDKGEIDSLVASSSTPTSGSREGGGQIGGGAVGTAPPVVTAGRDSSMLSGVSVVAASSRRDVAAGVLTPATATRHGSGSSDTAAQAAHGGSSGTREPAAPPLLGSGANAGMMITESDLLSLGITQELAVAAVRQLLAKKVKSGFSRHTDVPNSHQFIDMALGELDSNWRAHYSRWVHQTVGSRRGDVELSSMRRFIQQALEARVRQMIADGLHDTSYEMAGSDDNSDQGSVGSSSHGWRSINSGRRGSGRGGGSAGSRAVGSGGASGTRGVALPAAERRESAAPSTLPTIDRELVERERRIVQEERRVQREQEQVFQMRKQLKQQQQQHLLEQEQQLAANQQRSREANAARTRAAGIRHAEQLQQHQAAQAAAQQQHQQDIERYKRHNRDACEAVRAENGLPPPAADAEYERDYPALPKCSNDVERVQENATRRVVRATLNTSRLRIDISAATSELAHLSLRLCELEHQANTMVENRIESGSMDLSRDESVVRAEMAGLPDRMAEVRQRQEQLRAQLHLATTELETANRALLEARESTRRDEQGLADSAAAAAAAAAADALIKSGEVDDDETRRDTDAAIAASLRDHQQHEAAAARAVAAARDSAAVYNAAVARGAAVASGTRSQLRTVGELEVAIAERDRLAGGPPAAFPPTSFAGPIVGTTADSGLRSTQVHSVASSSAGAAAAATPGQVGSFTQSQSGVLEPQQRASHETLELLMGEVNAAGVELGRRRRVLQLHMQVPYSLNLDQYDRDQQRIVEANSEVHEQVIVLAALNSRVMRLRHSLGVGCRVAARAAPDGGGGDDPSDDGSGGAGGAGVGGPGRGWPSGGGRGSAAGDTSGNGGRGSGGGGSGPPNGPSAGGNAEDDDGVRQHDYGAMPGAGGAGGGGGGGDGPTPDDSVSNVGTMSSNAKRLEEIREGTWTPRVASYRDWIPVPKVSHITIPPKNFMDNALWFVDIMKEFREHVIAGCHYQIGQHNSKRKAGVPPKVWSKEDMQYHVMDAYKQLLRANLVRNVGTEESQTIAKTIEEMIDPAMAEAKVNEDSLMPDDLMIAAFEKVLLDAVCVVDNYTAATNFEFMYFKVGTTLIDAIKAMSSLWNLTEKSLPPDNNVYKWRLHHPLLRMLKGHWPSLAPMVNTLIADPANSLQYPGGTPRKFGFTITITRIIGRLRKEKECHMHQAQPYLPEGIAAGSRNPLATVRSVVPSLGISTPRASGNPSSSADGAKGRTGKPDGTPHSVAGKFRSYRINYTQKLANHSEDLAWMRNAICSNCGERGHISLCCKIYTKRPYNAIEQAKHEIRSKTESHYDFKNQCWSDWLALDPPQDRKKYFDKRHVEKYGSSKKRDT